jgi:hypothetical protein
MSDDQEQLPEGAVVVVSYHLHCPVCRTEHAVPARVPNLLFPGEKGARPGTTVTCSVCTLQYRVPHHVSLGEPGSPRPTTLESESRTSSGELEIGATPSESPGSSGVVLELNRSRWQSATAGRPPDGGVV